MSALALTPEELSFLHRMTATAAMSHLANVLSGKASEQELDEADFLAALAEKLSDAKTARLGRNRRRPRPIAEAHHAG